MASAVAKAQLPVLSKLVTDLAYVATRQPRAAAIELALAVQYDWRRNVDPYGNAWAPVLPTGKQLGKQDSQGRWRDTRGRFVLLNSDGTRRYDPSRHIADSYEPRVSGTDAMIVSEHRGSAALQKPYRRRPARRSHPVEGEGLGNWAPRFAKMHRDLLRGAVMGVEVRAQLKAAAALRKQERFERRNQERIAMGLRPLAPRRQRSDRARIEALAAKAIGGAG